MGDEKNRFFFIIKFPSTEIFMNLCCLKNIEKYHILTLFKCEKEIVTFEMNIRFIFFACLVFMSFYKPKGF